MHIHIDSEQSRPVKWSKSQQSVSVPKSGICMPTWLRIPKDSKLPDSLILTSHSRSSGGRYREWKEIILKLGKFTPNPIRIRVIYRTFEISEGYFNRSESWKYFLYGGKKVMPLWQYGIAVGCFAIAPGCAIRRWIRWRRRDGFLKVLICPLEWIFSMEMDDLYSFVLSSVIFCDSNRHF